MKLQCMLTIVPGKIELSPPSQLPIGVRFIKCFNLLLPAPHNLKLHQYTVTIAPTTCTAPHSSSSHPAERMKLSYNGHYSLVLTPLNVPHSL
ncbi:tetrathionate reductase family octaheme c-type cytochrome [Sesbania bispinosa]|nr:tetrathionate reductase family octaheme c-type cytochrome [Sesbania bispinosa]